jgi:hypothetical protein
MKAASRGWFVWVFAMLMPAGARSESLAPLSEQQQETLQSIWSILLVIYDNDAAQIPADPNSIMALETSQNPRDQLARALFTLMRHAIDPNAVDLTEPFSVDAAAPDASSKTSLDSEAAVSEPEESDEVRSLYRAMETVQEIDNPLGSCVLLPGTYRIQSLPLTIEGHVVMPAGVRLIAPYDPNTSVIEVMPGGLLETGRAAFYTDEDYPGILPPVEIIPEDPNIYFFHNGIGIYVHPGADPKTRLENLEIRGCYVGIVLDEQLIYPLRHVITVACYDGVHLYAPAGIVDCQFWYNGSMWDWMGDYILAHFWEYVTGTLFDSIAEYASAGLYVNLDGERFPSPEVLIARTVMDGGDVGLYVKGALADPNWPDPNMIAPFVPRVNVVNSGLTQSGFYGFYQTEGQAEIDMRYCAFGLNGSDTNIGLPFTGCIGLSEDPFYLSAESYRLYVDPRSPLVDAGYGMAEGGTGTCHDWPDTGRMDIGTHFPLGVSGGFGIPSSPADFNWDGVVDALDLELMEMCMGAITDPNIVKLDLNYDSRVNMPDFGVFAFDYGYSIDPNESANNDPNCARSDFDNDGRVDLADLAILSEYWLTVVTDEYRLCSLCDLNSNNDVNSVDYDLFMADWGKISQTDCAVSFANAEYEPVEPNRLSGVVRITLEEYPPSTWLFLQVDGMAAGETYSDGGQPAMFAIPTYEFANGNHTLTVGGYTPEDACWIQQFPVVFENRLYFATIPEMYEPNEPVEIVGFFDGGTMTIATDPNAATFSDTGHIRHTSTISADAAEATLTYENGEYAETQSIILAKSVNMAKIDPNSFRALIVAPDPDANEAFADTLEAIRNAIHAKGIPHQELLWKNATWDNISIALCGGNLNYVYWIGHGNSQIGEERVGPTRKVVKEGIHRTNFRCWKKGLVWDSQGDRIFSFLRSDSIALPVMPDILPEDWETRGHSMWSLGLYRNGKIKEFWAIGCETGLEWENAGNKYPLLNDMAYAVGAYRTDTAGNYVNVYMGNKTPVWTGWLLPVAVYYPSALANIIRNHSNNQSLEHALIYGPHGDEQRNAVWGADLKRGNDSDKDGYIDNVLQWWPLNTKLEWIQFY